MTEKTSNKETIFQNLSDNFDSLLPRDKETIFLLLVLHYKIQSREIDDVFSQKDFEDALDEVMLLLERERKIQKESISRRLSRHYYTTLRVGEEYRYQLSVFAKEFIKLLLNEISPQYENLELIHTFMRTLPIYEEDLVTIEKLEYWHRHHYSTSRKFILSHTDNLQRFVDKQVTALRTLLKPNADRPKQLIEQFLEIFEQLGRQTEGVTKALNFKQEIIDKIKNAENHFKTSREIWEKYESIQTDVIEFFENIDSRVLSINDKIQQARIRLKMLYDNLRYKQQYKLKIEKFLLLLLKHSQAVDLSDRPGKKIVLPPNIQKKEIPYFRDRFLFPPLIDFREFRKMESPFFSEDEEYKKWVEQDKMRQLARQENTIHWLGIIRGEIESGKEVVFEQWMDRIVAREQNLEVPVDVCFGMIDEYKNRDDVEIEIEKQLTVPLHSNVAVWKLKLKPIPFVSTNV